MCAATMYPDAIPLRSIKSRSSRKYPVKSIVEYVSALRERLRAACELAKHSLATTQSRMKVRVDKEAVERTFQVGDEVLVLLPLPGSAPHARFSGLYLIESKLSDTD
ncbi:uncharacterized protein LOC113081799, partial [Tachysurus ichikawai]